jgi:hypothetical protein
MVERNREGVLKQKTLWEQCSLRIRIYKKVMNAHLPSLAFLVYHYFIGIVISAPLPVWVVGSTPFHFSIHFS